MPFFVVSDFMHPDCSVPSFLLPVLVLLGSDRGVAVLHGCDRSPQESDHTQAFPVSWLGWGLSLFSSTCCFLFFPLCVHLHTYLHCLLIFLPGLPALVVAISVGFTKAKGYGTPS